MVELKYVKTEYGEVIIFPKAVNHSRFKEFNPVSAGFCVMHPEHVECYGESLSLNMKCDENKDSITTTIQIFGLEAAKELER